MPEPIFRVGAFRFERPRALSHEQWNNYHRALTALLEHVSVCGSCRGDRTAAGAVRQACRVGQERRRVVQLRTDPLPRSWNHSVP